MLLFNIYYYLFIIILLTYFPSCISLRSSTTQRFASLQHRSLRLVHPVLNGWNRIRSPLLTTPTAPAAIVGVSHEARRPLSLEAIKISSKMNEGYVRSVWRLFILSRLDMDSIRNEILIRSRTGRLETNAILSYTPNSTETASFSGRPFYPLMVN